MLKSYLHKAFSIFFILGFIFIPLTFYGLSFQYWLTRVIFLPPVAFIQNHFFVHAIKTIDFSSDTIAFNILLGLLSIVAFALTGLLRFFKKDISKINTWFGSVSAWYLAFVLLKYGFDKIFKHQFYLPESNILYSNFGSLTKDILYWSTMGLSHTYSVVTGAIEVLTAILLLIKRTRILGFCMAMAVLINIVIVNFSFDISVKTFSMFLLAAAVFNVLPYLQVMYAFFVQHKQVQLAPVVPYKTPIVKWAGWLAGPCIVLYSLLPYLAEGNFNDDLAPRPPLHGAYNIRSFIIGNDTLKSDAFPYARFFIHRHNYLIFQQKDGAMVDYFFELNPAKKQLTLHDYGKNVVIVAYDNSGTKGALKLLFNNSAKWTIEADTLALSKLPALQDNLHYTIDEIK